MFRAPSVETSIHPEGLPTVTPTHIAVLDDEADITELLSNYLSTQGYRVTQVHTGRDLLATMASDPPAIVLLDLGLPGEDGFAIARQLREHFRCGLVIVTGRGDSIDKVVGLEVGADDYVTKPFDLRELAARVKAVLRRTAVAVKPSSEAASAPGVAAPVSVAARERFGFAGWSFDTAARTLHDPTGAEVMLTGGEFDLLAVLVRHPGRVLSRDFLLEQTRGRDAAPFDRTIDVQIGRLRRKMEADSERPELIKSVRGAGYVLVPSVACT
jgi:two-component system, OmpR family, response regulator